MFPPFARNQTWLTCIAVLDANHYTTGLTGIDLLVEDPQAIGGEAGTSDGGGQDPPGPPSGGDRGYPNPHGVPAGGGPQISWTQSPPGMPGPH